MIYLYLLLLISGSHGDLLWISDYLKQHKSSIVIRNTSHECDTQRDIYFEGIANGDDWAWKMLDATGKIPPAIMKGNVFDLGFYDECVDVKEEVNGLAIPYDRLLNSTNFTSVVSNIKNGLFIHQPITKGTPFLSLCIPDKCMPKDIVGELGVDISCETKGANQSLDGSDTACLVFLGVIVSLMTLSTVYDVYLHQYEKKTAHPIYLAFSVYTNGKKILTARTDLNRHLNSTYVGSLSVLWCAVYTAGLYLHLKSNLVLSPRGVNVLSDTPNHILCLDGIRSLSLFSIIGYHTLVFKTGQMFVMNVEDVKPWKRNWYSVYGLQAPLAVDSFLFLSGTLLSYNFLKSMDTPHAKFNIFLYYIHKYIRLTPALGAAWFVTITITRRIGSGPAWNSLFELVRKTCFDNWWAVFFYLVNYKKKHFLCLGHTWYLSMDMQIFVVSPLILLPLLKFRKQTLLYGLPVLIFASLLCPFLILLLNNVEMWSYDYYYLYYFDTHTRLPSWLIGIGFGVLLLKVQQTKFKIDWYKNIWMWVFNTVVMVVIIFTQSEVAFSHNKWKTAFYLPLSKAAWSVCLSWIILACVNGSGAFVNWFLSMPFFQVIGKLSYSVYLVHFTVVIMIMMHRQTPTMFADFENIYESVANIVFSVFVGTIWTLAFDRDDHDRR